MKRRKLINIIIQMMIFTITFMVSKNLFQDVYLFKWTSDRCYLYIWIVVLLLTYLGKYKISYAITISNIIGLFLGQYLGDYIVILNQTKITSNMSAEDVYRLSKHPGVLIWFICITLSIFLVLLINSLDRRKLR